MNKKISIFLTLKRIIRKPLFWFGALICYFVISHLLQESDNRIDKSRITEHYSSLDLSIEPQDKYREEYELLINTFLKYKKIHVLAKSRGGILFGKPCEIIGDYFTTPELNDKYFKVESDSDGIQFPINKKFEKLDLNDIEKKENFKKENIDDIFRLMRKLDIKWISKNKNYIEFSNEVYPADKSLDYYNGYLYCLNDSFPQIDKKVYYVLYRLEGNWYYFVRETYKGPVIYSTYPETDEDFQYLENEKNNMETVQPRTKQKHLKE